MKLNNFDNLRNKGYFQKIKNVLYTTANQKMVDVKF